MLKRISRKFFAGAIFFVHSAYAQDSAYKIMSDRPARHFTEAMPLGNGRLGAMVFGDPDTERISLNEISLWSGGPQDADKDSAFIHLKPIQNLLLQQRNAQAQALLMEHFTAKGEGTALGRGAYAKYGSYQTAGNLIIRWSEKHQHIQQYQNALDLRTAVAEMEYFRNGTKIKQSVFTDFANDLLWIKLSSDHQMPDFELSLERKEHVHFNLAEDQTLLLKGQLPDGKEPGMRYAVVARILKNDGRAKANGPAIKITGAKTIVLALDIRTDYHHGSGQLRSHLDLEEMAIKNILRAEQIGFDKALERSAQIYQQYFTRTALQLNTANEQNLQPTYSRLQQFSNGKVDPHLLQLYFNFGKYLLIASSRPGLLPANLQGLWAEEYQAPWNADYHLNINLQMNYWPAEVLNLPELAEPLFRFTKNLVPNGRKTAQKYYGAKGWVAHVVSNPWFYTAPGEGAEWGSTLTGGAWLATHIWEHYRFTKDRKFLKEYYPVLKSSAEFLKDILIQEVQHNWLVTAPSNSPENTYIMPNGYKGNTCMGPTMDMQIARNVFSAVVASSDILKTDPSFRSDLMATRAQLAPNQISALDGGIQEWLHDWPSAEPQHRHVSHLFGLYPYDEITPESPELFQAAKQTLLLRGDGGTGWSKAWKINFWARLMDGNHAFTMLKSLLTPVTFTAKGLGGTYPNLFDAHPPFQIDGNFGAVAGMAEMLLQSHGKNEVIRLLPALPKNENFRSGSFSGFRARNNFEVSCKWDDFEVKSAQIISRSGELLNIELPRYMALYTPSGKILAESGAEPIVARVKTSKGQTIILKSIKNQ